MVCIVSSDDKLAKRFKAVAPHFSVLSAFCMSQKAAPIFVIFIFFNSNLLSTRGLLVTLDSLQSYPTAVTNAGTAAPEHMVLLLLQEQTVGTQLLYSLWLL